MTAIVLIVTVLLLVLLLNGMPVAFTMLVAGGVGVYLVAGWDTMAGVMSTAPYEQVASYTLSTLPMFILMAEFLTAGGFTADIFRAFYKWSGHMRGGLAYAVIFGGAMLAAISGSSSAAAGTLAGAAHPEMRRYGYDDSFATGVMAMSGTLSIMIPPSIAFIIFGIITETSVGALLLAGILPGLLTALGYVLAIRLSLWHNPALAPTAPGRFPLRERVETLSTVWPVMLLMVMLLAAIYSGAATVTEIGAVGAAAALVIALAMRRMTLRSFVKAVTHGTRNSAMILAIIAGASVFGIFVTLSGVPQMLVQAVESAGVDRWVVFSMILVLLLILGFFLDQLAVMVLTLPIIFPLLLRLGFEPIWFGVILVKTVEIGLVTPPMGLNCFVVSSVTGVPAHKVFRGIWWLVLVDMLVLLALILFPQISLTIPRWAGAM
ncbi:TRAP transporter large permease [Ancylobacter sp. MQZ15Z-1]|uniref:TRAP transporter large permease protein n=1 Tax=Ancylobacter mangrovi TaxID=2972472 RepID=A0A9X2PCP9_9HYPH|nr:TRAP transporter large permease [Ancylobacter mangrovi]MCS0494476.1 TRAP transporter large permease [Ancylobacter mangrovi]